MTALGLTPAQRGAVNRTAVAFAMSTIDAHLLLLAVEWDETRAALAATLAQRLHITWRKAVVQMARAAALSEVTADAARVDGCRESRR